MALKTQFPSCFEQYHPKESLSRLSLHVYIYFMNTYWLVNKHEMLTKVVRLIGAGIPLV